MTRPRVITTFQNVAEAHPIVDRIKVTLSDSDNSLPPFRVAVGANVSFYIDIEDLDTLIAEAEAARRDYLNLKWNNVPAFVDVDRSDPDGDFSDLAQLADGDVPADVDGE